MAGRGQRVRRRCQDGLGQRCPGRDPQLFRDEIEIRHELRHAVLDLEARVDLEEPEPPLACRTGIRRSRRCAASAARAARMARSCSSARSSGVRPGAGDSSTSFWWRRWIEQSRSPSATIVPSASPSSCTSMCRAGRTSRSRYTAPSPNAASASADAGGQGGRQTPPRDATRRMPRPPPPAEAFTSNGKPTSSAAATTAAASSGRSTAAASNVPGTTGTPASLRRPARRQLVAEGVDGVGRRSDEGETGVDHRSRECRALGQESVARVDRLGARREGGLDDRVGAEVALRRRRRTQAHRGVGRLDMGRIRDRHRSRRRRFRRRDRDRSG